MPKISVIIPVYNRSCFCKQAIRMLKKQTLKRDIEFILVDDGSSDDTYIVLKQLVTKDKRFKLLHYKKNTGPSFARNLALKKAKGEYIGFFDIDDKIKKGYFKKLYKKAIKNKSDIVFTAYNNKKYNKGLKYTFTDKISQLNNGAVWNKIFSRKLIVKNKITFPEGFYCADNVFLLKAFYYAKSVFVTNDPVYRYLIQQDSIGANIDKVKIKKRSHDIIEIIRQIISFFQNKNLSDREKQILYQFINRSLNSYSGTNPAFARRFNMLCRKLF